MARSREAGRTARARKAEIKRDVRARLGSGADEIMQHEPFVSFLQVESQSRALQRLVKKSASADLFMPRLNAAILYRLEHPGRGVRSAKSYMSSDCDRAASSQALDSSAATLATLATRHGMRIRADLVMEEIPRATTLIGSGANTPAGSRRPSTGATLGSRSTSPAPTTPGAHRRSLSARTASLSQPSSPTLGGRLPATPLGQLTRDLSQTSL